jgi:hypothetical protein
MLHTRLVRRGRLVMAVALTLCAGFVLSACRSEPGVAAYVGDDVLTESEIDSTIDEVVKASQESARVPSRSDVVVTFVLNKGCAAKQAQEKFASAPVTIEAVANAESIPANTQYARDRTALHACVGGVPTTDTVPTEAELREIFDRAIDEQLIDPATVYEQVKGQIAGDSRVIEGLATRHLLSSLVADGEVSVNPRYRPLNMGFSAVHSATGASVPLVMMTIGEPGSDAVRDIG